MTTDQLDYINNLTREETIDNWVVFALFMQRTQNGKELASKVNELFPEIATIVAGVRAEQAAGRPLPSLDDVPHVVAVYVWVELTKDWSASTGPTKGFRELHAAYAMRIVRAFTPAAEKLKASSP